MKITAWVMVALALCSFSVAATAQTITPLAMSLKAVGGGPLNTNTPGVANGIGLNNIGLLIRVWGSVTYVDSSATPLYFYIDDGSGLSDGSGYTGVRVALDNLAASVTITPPAQGNVIALTAISSTFLNVSGQVYPNLRPRSQADVVNYTGP